MVCERVDISILVVEDDDTSLAMVAHILNSLEYKVLVAKGAHNGLETLREFEGFFNLVIAELHISGMMNGFEFQKRVQNEFQLPVIMMSADSRKSVVSKCLENGAAHFIFKPICKDDFKDIWQYALVARKGKQTIENIEGPNDNKIIVQNVNSYAASSLIEPKRKRKYGQTKSPQMSMEDQSDGSTRLVKKQKVVWTTYLHNLFLLAIKQIGLERAVPKKILQIMNVPNLTRENVASHLQKYRIFLRKVAEKGLLEGLSQRTLRSKFASGLSVSMIRDIQRRTTKLRVPVQQYLKSSLAHQTENGGNIANVVTPFNHVSRSAYVTTPLERGHDQFPYPLHKGLNLMLQNQHGGSLNNVAILGGVESRYGSNVIDANNIQQKMVPYQAKSSYNLGSVFPTYGTMGHSLMISTNGLTGGFKYCEPMYQNYGSLENHHNFGYGQGNWNMGSLNISRNNQPWTSSIYNPSTSIQMNGGSKMVGNGIKGGVNSTIGTKDSTTNKNGFGLINGTTQNTNMNMAPLGHGNFGSTHGNSKAGDGWSSEVPKALINNGTHIEKGSGITQLTQRLSGNVAQNEHQYNATSISEGMVSHMEDDLSELFLVLDEMNLLNGTEENHNASEFFKSGPSSSSQVVKSFEQQSNRAGDVIVNPMKSTINLPNESLTSSDKSSNQLPSDDGFADMEPFDKFIVDDVSSAASNSATNDQDWEMELIEALFGGEAYKRESEGGFKDHGIN